MKKIFKVLLMLVLPVLSLAGQKELREKIEYLIMPDFRYWQMSGETEKKDFKKSVSMRKISQYNTSNIFPQPTKYIKCPTIDLIYCTPVKGV